MSSPVPAVIAFCRNERRDRPAEADGVEVGTGFAAFSAEVVEAMEVKFSLRGGMGGIAASAASKRGGDSVYYFVLILIHLELSLFSAFVRKERLLCSKRLATQVVETEAQAIAWVDKPKERHVR